MTIGRSGTGKTTCALMRLFAIELLFKLKLSLLQKRNSKLFNKFDLEKNIGIHCIFATTSPYLTFEVQKQYYKMTHQVKQQLRKKELKMRKAQKESELIKNKIIEEEDKVDYENIEENYNEKQELNEQIENDLKNIELGY